MYNNTIYQTGYRPYTPQIKKRNISQEQQEAPTESQKQAVTPNNYQEKGQRQSTAYHHSVPIQTGSKKINISQLLIDFESTINAIGAPPDVEEEVRAYLNLVGKQTDKELPSKKIITSNLKSAAEVLDGYITKALNKSSKVVTDWVDALLMQSIDFKADKSIKKGAFETITGEAPQTARLAKENLAKKSALKETAPSETAPPQETIKSGNDEIENTIKKADDIAKTNPQESQKLYSKAFEMAQKTGDKLAMAEIYSKIANLQNSQNNLSQALDCLNASALLAYEINDTYLRAGNHTLMGRIYDDNGNMDAAMNHYFKSVGLNGENDNIQGQTGVLTAIGKMFTKAYSAKEALQFYKVALDGAKQTSDLSAMSEIFQNTALTHKNTGAAEKALKYLKDSAIITSKLGDETSLSQIYEQAGDFMKDSGHAKRAADFYQKSYKIAQRNNLQDGLIRLREKLLA
ncbi:MAG: hypothetical protein PHX18_02285 [Candidatus Gastranaerophilales bacterium]|nr:hypothetical protein [Candidatus Gastranaerophilales bacterium]